MTDLRKAAEIALEALDAYSWEQVDAATKALRQALAQQDSDCERCKGVGCVACDSRQILAQSEQEPVAWMNDYNACKCPDNESRCFSDRVFRMMQKYTAPPKRELVGLTDEEILDAADAFGSFQYGDAQGHKRLDFAKVIEAKLKEKNT